VHRRDLLFGAAAMAGALAVTGPIRAQESTPESDGPQALAMLRFAPADLLEDAGDTPILATVADVAARTESAGVDLPTSRDDNPSFGDWGQAINGLLYTSAMLNAFSPDWLAAFGWDAFQVDQTLEYGQPPDNAQVYIGRFDRDAINDALLAADYETIEIDGAAEAWSRSPEGDVDVASEAGRLALGGMNNVALMPDGALITARTLDAATLIVETAAGERDSLAANDLVQTLLGAQTTLLDSAMLVPGTSLAGMIDPIAVLDEVDEEGPGESALDRTADRIATQIAEQAGMPPVLLALIGTTGEIPVSRACFTLLMASEDDAETAVAVVEERLETGESIATQQPWSELFSGWTVTAVEDAPVLTVELETERPNMWFDLVFNRDTGFIAW